MATRTKPGVVVPMTAPPKPRASKHLVLGLGLATLNVSIAPITSKPRDGGAHYICPDHRVKVQQRWYCPTGDHIIQGVNDKGEDSFSPTRGYPVGDQYVVLSKETLDEIALPKDGSITFEQWDDHLDPVWVEKTYLLWPDDDASTRTYVAVAAALAKDGMVLFGESTISKTTHLMALAWSRDLSILVLHQLNLSSGLKLREAAGISTWMANETPPKAVIVNEVKRVVNTVLERGVEHDLPDRAREALMAAIEEIATGGILSEGRKKKPAKRAESHDLLESLRQSVKQAEESKKKKARKK